MYPTIKCILILGWLQWFHFNIYNLLLHQLTMFYFSLLASYISGRGHWRPGGKCGDWLYTEGNISKDFWSYKMTSGPSYSTLWFLSFFTLKFTGFRIVIVCRYYGWGWKAEGHLWWTKEACHERLTNKTANKIFFFFLFKWRGIIIYAN